jgi:hypothetical protein
VTVKVRDASGVLRTVVTLKIRGADNVLRTIDFVRVRGSDNVLRTVYTNGSGGGTPAPSNPTSISPGGRSASGKPTNYTAYFTGMSSTTAPTTFAWSVIEGPGTIISGGNAATAQLRIYVDQDNSETATFACDMTVGGTVYRATCTLSYTSVSGNSQQQIQ